MPRNDFLRLEPRSAAVPGREFWRRLAARRIAERDPRQTRRRDACARTRRFLESGNLQNLDAHRGHEPVGDGKVWSPGFSRSGPRKRGTPNRRLMERSMFRSDFLNEHEPQRGQAATKVAQTSKSAVSRFSKSADRATSSALPTWKSATQQVWKPALRQSIAPAKNLRR